MVKTKTKKSPRIYYVMGLNHQGIWFRSMATENPKFAQIRYVDLQTIEMAAIITIHLKITNIINGQSATQAKKYIKFARGKQALKAARGVPIEEINRTLRPESNQPLRFDCARGCSKVGEHIRPGFKSNSWKAKDGLIINAGLLPSQQRLASQQVALRKAAGLPDNARV